MTAKLGPPLDQLLAPHLAADAVGAGGRPVPRALPRPRGRRRARRCPARTRPSRRTPPPRPGGRGDRQVPGQRPAARRPPRPRRGPCSRAGCGASGKADVLRREGVSIYVGDHVHDVEGARAAGALSVSVLTGGCTRAELEEAGTDVMLDSLAGVPGLARRAPARHPARGAGARPQGARQRPGRLQRRRGQRVPARRCGPGARTRARGRGDRLLRLAARRSSATRPATSRRASAWRCSPRRPTRWSATATAPTAATAASSARPS